MNGDAWAGPFDPFDPEDEAQFLDHAVALVAEDWPGIVAGLRDAGWRDDAIALERAKVLRFARLKAEEALASVRARLRLTGEETKVH